jgi:hypothetical protein
MSVLDVLDNRSLYGKGGFGTVARSIADAAQARATGEHESNAVIGNALMYGFERLLVNHFTNNSTSWGGANAIIMAVKKIYGEEVNTKQKHYLAEIDEYISKQQVEITNEILRSKELFAITEDDAKAALPAPTPPPPPASEGKKRKERKDGNDDSDSELCEEDFSFDLELPKLYTHFKNMSTKINKLSIKTYTQVQEVARMPARR